MFSCNVRYKNSCLYQTLGYKGTPYNTIGCIPLAYPYDDRVVSITVTANPANIGTTFITSSSPQSVATFTLSGATSYEIIGQTMTDGENTYDNMLSYTLNGNTVSVSAIVETAGVYNGGLTVRGITGNVYADIFVPVTINALSPTPTSIFSRVPSPITVQSRGNVSNYFGSNVTASIVDGDTLNINESNAYYNGSTSAANYLAVPTINDTEFTTCFEFTPEFLQGKSTITIDTLYNGSGSLSNSGCMPFIMRGDDLINVQNTKKNGGAYYGYTGSSKFYPISDVMPVDSNNRYYICIGKTGTSLSSKVINISLRFS